MSDVALAADVTPSHVPIDPNEVHVPNPVEVTLPQAEKPEAKAEDADKTPAKTPGEAVKRAMDKVKAKEASKEADEAKDPQAVKAEAPEAKPVKEPQPRGEGGKFASANPEPDVSRETESKYPDAPQRFSNDGKAAWREAPEQVKAEVHRAVEELERGYEKHRADATAFADLKPFVDLATQSGTNLKTALTNYVNLEKLVRTDPVAGFEKIAQNLGFSMRDFAAHILGQKPEQVSSRQDGLIRELRQQIGQLQQQVGGVVQSVQQQREQAITGHVATFASQPGHERFDELAPDIEMFLKSGRAETVDEAYSLAERLNPAAGKPATAAAPGTQVAAERRPVNPAGTKSIAGSPTPGSTPTGRQEPVPDTLTALKRAAARARG